jgi:hypothetical protein
MSAPLPAEVRLHIFRSRFIGAYARMEFSLGKLIAFASRTEPYAPHARKMPPYLKQKRDLLDRLATMDGPWRTQLEAIRPALLGLAFYDDMRNTLAHATGHVSAFRGITHYVFNTVLIRDDSASDCVSTIDEPTAEVFLDDVQVCVRQIAETLDTITGWTEADLPEILVRVPSPRT